MKRILASCVILGLAFCSADFADEAEEGCFICNHLELGMRITHFVLVDEDDDSFLGSIDHLGDEQDYAPYKVYADWLFCPFGGIELTWDRVEAVAKTSADDDHTDGNFVLEGPIVTVFGRYPNESIFQPYGGLGAAFYSTDFEAQDWWALGFASPADFEALGSPNEPRNGRSREISTDDTVGLVVTAGTDIKINEHWSADLYFRYTAVDVDAHFALLANGHVVDDKGTFNIPFDNYAGGLGVKYVF